ncbi:ATP-dependent DNA ligase clustered with Ku protein, LigD [Mesorhizobium escarrei]|uniref:ATP-dependent DNA ligase clustered with Ku protein, LigD n=1 Tax=Mesorhizobium escarrei TaxID=666018 RepID=A0ABM9DWB7_9HYPH|nr:ATP-dependent DNA ligase clustered with Ku protein, LigD [Mesorhizobium escarrei]
MIVDGEVIVLNKEGHSEFAELRKAITQRQHDLYFVALDLLHLNGHDLRDMQLEDRREILGSLIEARQPHPIQRGTARRGRRDLSSPR